LTLPRLIDVKRRLGAAVSAAKRRWLFRPYLHGSGIELGALHAPFRVPRTACVTYVDRLPADELRQHYPELSAQPFVAVDVVDDAETLEVIASSSQNFVIASHVLEHCEDPIGALCNWLRVLKPGGAVMLAVPDKRYTFDTRRPITPLAHVIRDHVLGPSASRATHYEEWVQVVEGRSDPSLSERAQELAASGYRIHFHVWDFDALAELLDHCASRVETAHVACLSRNRSENLAVLTKDGDRTPEPSLKSP
jgi:ubiquinone/menaquinone biosynthesis C-methylase UbiE